MADPATGKLRVSFKYKLHYSPIELPCGSCEGCRQDRGRAWALRIMHEAQLHEVSCFVTLTYDAKHLPPGGTLCKRDFQLFMKKLRRSSPGKIRFYHCGEYGEALERPHYHAVLFGVDFADKVFHTTGGGGDIYRSPALTALWGKGHATLMPVTYESAAYCAGYVVKKQTGEAAKRHYTRLDVKTGELVSLMPEYSTMSLKPGLGRNWFRQFWPDLYPDDFAVSGGKVRGKPPRYYDKLLKAEYPGLSEQVKGARIARATEPRQAANSTRKRLAIRETVARARRNLRKRNLS